MIDDAFCLTEPTAISGVQAHMATYRDGWVGTRPEQLRVALERTRRKLPPLVRRTLSPELTRELEELEERLSTLGRPSDLSVAEELYRRYAECADVAVMVAPQLRKKRRLQFFAAGIATIAVALLAASFVRADQVNRAHTAIHTPLVCPPMACLFEVPEREGCTLEARLHNPLEYSVWFIMPPPVVFSLNGPQARMRALAEGRVAVRVEPDMRITVGSWHTTESDFQIVVAEGELALEQPRSSRDVYPIHFNINGFTGHQPPPMDRASVPLLAAVDGVPLRVLSIAPEQIWRSAACS